MQQFGSAFISHHLMPLLERVLTDTVKKDTKLDYLDKFFVTGTLEGTEMAQFDSYYFVSGSAKKEGVPFAGTDAEDVNDRKKLLQFMVNYMHGHAVPPISGIQAFSPFLPVVNEKSGVVKEVVWPAQVKNNLYLMCLNIGENFEHEQMEKLIKAKAATGNPADVEAAKADAELLAKGQLMLVKDPATGQFTRYIRASEVKPGDTVVQFLPPPSPEMETAMKQGFSVPSATLLASLSQGAKSPQTVSAPSTFEGVPATAVKDVVSTDKQIGDSFEQKRAKAVQEHMKQLGLVPLGDVQFDNNHNAFWKVKSGGNTLMVQINMNVPPGQPLKISMTFQDGELNGLSLAGKKLVIDESKLDQAFKKEAGVPRTALDVYGDKKLCSDLGIQSDAYPPMAGAFQPAPVIALPGAPGAPGEPFKLPTGIQPPGAPLGPPGPGLIGKGAVVGGPPAKLAAGPVVPPPVEQGKESVGVKLKFKPVPGKPGVAFAGVPGGTPMAAKIAQEQELQPPQFGAAGMPIAPGRVGGATLALAGGEKKKPGGLGPLGIVTLVNGTVLGGSISTGFGIGLIGTDTGTPAAVAFKVIKGVWLAFGHYLPHLFG